MKRLSYGDHANQPVAVAIPPQRELSQLQISAHSRLLVLDRLEKPGNLGACLRTACAVGVDAVILTDSRCEVLNPNTIRSSRGSVFKIFTCEASVQEIVDLAFRNKLKIYAARVGESRSLWDIDLTAGAVVVFGNEAEGLGENWLQNGIESFTIPMQSSVDSLNVSISCAVTLFEWQRQVMIK